MLCIVLLVATWFLLINPRRAHAADLRSQTVSAQDQAAQLQVQIAELRAQFADLPKRKAELKAIKQQLPPKAEMSAFVRSMQNISTRAGLNLDSITTSTPLVVAASGSALAGAALPGTAPVGSVVSVPVTLVVTGDYFEASLFLKYLQTTVVRSYLITGLAGVPSKEPPVATTAPAVTSAPTTTATATATPVPVATTAAAGPDTLDRVALTITGSVFVLMDGTSTLEEVTKEAAAATAGTTAGTPAATTAPVAAPVTAPTAAAR